MMRNRRMGTKTKKLSTLITSDISSVVAAPAPHLTTIKPALCLQLYNLLEHPKLSLAVLLVHVLVTALITFSNSVTILETMPVSRLLPGGIWFGIETSLVALFTIEYVTQQTFWIWLPRQPLLTIVPNTNC
jgi:hypothetical protein